VKNILLSGLLFVLLGGCATYPEHAPRADERSQFAARELVSSGRRVDMVVETREKLGPPDDTEWYETLFNPGISGFPIIGLFSSDGSLSYVSKYALPETVDGQAIDSPDAVDRVLLNMVSKAGRQAGGRVMLEGQDYLVFESKLDEGVTNYLLVYNKGSVLVETPDPLDEYAWGFSPKWKSERPTSLYVCQGNAFALTEEGDIKYGEDKKGRILPILDCELGTSVLHTRFLEELTTNPYFLYADKSPRVNRFYFQEKVMSPFF